MASIYQKIVERLDKLRSLYKLIADPTVKLAEFEHPTSVLSLESIVKFEKEHHVKLPDEYAKFLLEVFNGGIGPGNVLYTLHDSYYSYWMNLGPLNGQCNLNQEVYSRKLEELIAHHGKSAQVDPTDVPATNFQIDGKQYYITGIVLPTRPTESLLNAGHRQHLSALFDKKEARQGCLLIGYGGDSIFYFLIITGPERGKIWKCDNGCYIPTKFNFVEWYEDWLNRTLILLRDQANYQKQQIVTLQEKAQLPTNENLDAALKAGIWFFKHSQLEKAKKFFSESLKMSAEKGLFKLLFQTCLYLCKTLLKMKDLDSCLRTAQVGEKQVARVFSLEVRLDLKEAEEYRVAFKYYRAVVLFKKQSIKEAADILATIINYDYAKARYYYGKCLIALERVEEALNYFHRTDHTSTSLYLELANLELEKKHYDKALQYSMTGIFSKIGKQSRKQELTAVFSKSFIELWTKDTSNPVELVNCLENVEDALPNDPNIRHLITLIEE